METLFKSRRIYLSNVQLLNSTPEKVFPLLCPKREYDWIEPWKCDIIYSDSGFAELDAVFITNFPDEGREVWVVDRYVKNEMIQFIRTSDFTVTRHRITLTLENEKTKAHWEKWITALNEKGNEVISEISPENHDMEIKTLEKMLNHYLSTGEMLKM